MDEKLMVYRVGFNGNDETEVHAMCEDEAVELAKMVASESGLEFELDYVEYCGYVGENQTEDAIMNNRYEATAIAIRQAEEALKVLKEFSEMQYEAKGETMTEQIVDYITNTLSDTDYMCCGCKYNHLALSNMKDYFVFYIYDNSVIGTGYPVFSITNNGEVKYINKLSEWMMLNLIKDWNGFKESLDFAIKTTLKEKTKNINRQLSYIGYVNEQLAQWRV